MCNYAGVVEQTADTDANNDTSAEHASQILCHLPSHWTGKVADISLTAKLIVGRTDTRNRGRLSQDVYSIILKEKSRVNSLITENPVQMTELSHNHC